MDLLRSLPIGLYLEKPITWLHQLDPRVKLVWLMTFLASPILANPLWQLGVVGILILLTIAARIPLRVWRQQMGWLIILSIFILIITAIAPDGLAVNAQPRLLDGDLSLPQPTDYNYILFDKGRLITRRSVELGIRISTLIFILIYSTNLYLLTTAPEEITAGLEDLLAPLRHLKLPITEIMLTLTLSLRFIPLVLEELQNLARSIRTRAINWKKLGIKRALQVWLVVVEKLLENLLMRAEEIAVAMEVRGFTNPNEHRVQWHQLRLIQWDWVALAILIPFWWARVILGKM
ncbi:MAG: energy-coupling factor transporter transmembrane component T family protein [cyanobacterium endosymbiont of Rhopalodia musculus]|uniref:energy-coupling factor transporter transmembrane component T family protein n=1 Tax=cyanobacterium endosymbiont of Epithemia clementina EcSB TaxID=3034674 RepID=UPI00247FAD9F|nr:energy-coupling factor transporter transmembrane protein EcfT [cyanobacterium endosymbiont of Epithemia clementina EcSB]WGT67808.1 energy-coupling factor transporter transmembrane protein EcfT [cyanobacterium endosymbiont of Epithemia clementina EcSB]